MSDLLATPFPSSVLASLRSPQQESDTFSGDESKRLIDHGRSVTATRFQRLLTSALDEEAGALEAAPHLFAAANVYHAVMENDAHYRVYPSEDWLTFKAVSQDVADLRAEVEQGNLFSALDHYHVGRDRDAATVIYSELPRAQPEARWGQVFASIPVITIAGGVGSVATSSAVFLGMTPAAAVAWVLPAGFGGSMWAFHGDPWNPNLTTGEKAVSLAEEYAKAFVMFQYLGAVARGLGGPFAEETGMGFLQEHAALSAGFATYAPIENVVLQTWETGTPDTDLLVGSSATWQALAEQQITLVGLKATNPFMRELARPLEMAAVERAMERARVAFEREWPRGVEGATRPAPVFGVLSVGPAVAAIYEWIMGAADALHRATKARDQEAARTFRRILLEIPPEGINRLVDDTEGTPSAAFKAIGELVVAGHRHASDVLIGCVQRGDADALAVAVKIASEDPFFAQLLRYTVEMAEHPWNERIRDELITLDCHRLARLARTDIAAVLALDMLADVGNKEAIRALYALDVSFWANHLRRHPGHHSTISALTLALRQGNEEARRPLLEIADVQGLDHNVLGFLAEVGHPAAFDAMTDLLNRGNDAARYWFETVRTGTLARMASQGDVNATHMLQRLAQRQNRAALTSLADTARTTAPTAHLAAELLRLMNVGEIDDFDDLRIIGSFGNVGAALALVRAWDAGRGEGTLATAIIHFDAGVFVARAPREPSLFQILGYLAHLQNESALNGLADLVAGCSIPAARTLLDVAQRGGPVCVRLVADAFVRTAGQNPAQIQWLWRLLDVIDNAFRPIAQDRIMCFFSGGNDDPSVSEAFKMSSWRFPSRAGTPSGGAN